MIKVTLVSNSGRKTVMVSEDSTVREVLEENDINYSIGITAIDSAPLKPGEIDNTFIEMGINDSCYLSVVVKADNAANAVIAGNAVVVTSSLKREEIALVKKFRPKALQLLEGEGKDAVPVFAIGLSESSAGHINKNGVTFGPTASADGNATVTLLFDPDVADVAKEFSETFGSAMLNLQILEESIPAQLEEIRADAEAVQSMITRL